MWDWLYPWTRIEHIGTPYEPKKDLFYPPEYDYIIVGGGTAGCVLANRLSQNPSVTVLLLERGNISESIVTQNTLLSFPPFGFAPHKEIKTVPQKQVNGKVMSLWEARALGGRTRINGTLYLQGCPEEYKSWGKGWSWEEVGPIFARFERRLEFERERAEGHVGGEWATRVIQGQFESTRQFEAALKRMGVESIDAYTDPTTPTCFGLYPRRNLDLFGRRSSTYHAFLPKSLVRRRDNLTICLGCNVQRILFSEEKDGLTATSVLVEGKGKKLYLVRSTHEIILSVLLALGEDSDKSGVGPKEHLREIGIPCIHDLPGVGSTLQDHFHVAVNYFVPIADSAHRLLANLLIFLWSLIQFMFFGTGLLLSIVTEYFVYLHTQKLPPNHDRKSLALPDVELFWTAGYGNNAVPDFVQGKGAACIMVQCCVPKSIGTVRLSPAGAHDVAIDPIVDPNYLSAPEDWEVYRRGIIFALEVGGEMANGGYPLEEIHPLKSTSLKDLDEFVSKYGFTGQHPLSSCRMRPLKEGGVVDQELRVHGIRGLRIADGSIFPTIVASRPQATVVMVAEKCADMIREGWNGTEMLSSEEKGVANGSGSKF